MKYITEENLMELIDQLKVEFDKLGERFDRIEERLDKIDERLNYHQTWLERIESNMATKGQLNSLLNILEDKKIINSFEVAHIKQTDSL